MIIDTSAAIALIRGEPEADRIAHAIEADPVRRMSTANALETAMVAEGLFADEGARLLDGFFFESTIELVPFEADHFRLARQAFRRYGKGRHPAALNLGDCFAYALSRATGEPLLFKGNDFSQTDVASVAY